MKKSTTPTFLLELPLRVDAGQVKRLCAHFEAARCLYNALLGEAMKRLRQMRADAAWQEARAIPQAHKQERKEAFARLRQGYGFSEYALHEFAKEANCSWIADHIDAVMAQTLATRAYRAANRVCLGEAKKVRFKSKGRGLDSVENKRNNTGLRFLLQPPDKGNQGWLLWRKDLLPALIDWDDPVVHHGLRHPIKYARLVRRKASSSKAQGADTEGYRYYVQLALEGLSYQKPKHTVGSEVVGLDLGPSTIAIVPQEGEAQLLPLCAELQPDVRAKRRLQRKLDRQRRANNPQNYDDKGHIKKRGKQRLVWKNSKSEFPTNVTKLSQYCHGCSTYTKKSLSQRWHSCSCGIGPVQRDLYSAFLAAHLELPNTIPSIAHDEWEGAGLRLLAAVGVLQQRAKEGQSLPRSVGIPRAGARLPESLAPNRLELVYRRGRLEALG